MEYTLTYIYKGVANYETEKQFYQEVLQARLVWEFARFGTEVVAFQLGNALPLTLLASHLSPEQLIFIYRVPNLTVAQKNLENNGLQFEGTAFGVPDGSCLKFKTPTGQVYGIYEATKPANFLREEYLRQQQEGT